jgi:hypothetical protein
MGKPIGELQGGWAFMMKVALVMLPIVVVSLIGFGSWIVLGQGGQDMSLTSLTNRDELHGYKFQEIESLRARDHAEKIKEREHYHDQYASIKAELSGLGRDITEIKILLRTTPADVLDHLKKK